MSNEGNEFKPELRLFVKAPLIKGDRDSKFSEDIFSHRFMFIIAKKEIPNAKVVPVDPVYKKDTLLKFGITDSSVKIPFIQHIISQDNRSTPIDDPQHIENYLETKFQPYLRSNDPKAYKVQLDVFQKFMFFLKTEKGSDAEQAKLKVLNDELRKIDKFLTDNERQFLGGDTIALPDCNLLPKLHYIRVAGKYYKQFEIPEVLTALKRYVEAGDLDESFQESKCTDKEIIEGYKKHAR